MIDLTPFNFTSTESRVYGALLAEGTSSGYSLAKVLGLARANVYQALDALVAKGAAVLHSDDTPRRFRAVAPRGLLALIAQRETALLDRLEREVFAARAEGADPVIQIEGRRAFEQVALRTAAKPAGEVRAIATAPLLKSLTPIWRKRAADGSPTVLLSIGPPAEQLPLPIVGSVSPEDSFGIQALLVTPDAVIGVHGDLSGYWSSDRIFISLGAAAVDLLTERCKT